MFLLKSTALALVSASSVYAINIPHVLRGFVANKEEAMVAVKASCAEGAEDGTNALKKLWKNEYDNDCDNVWGLDDAADDLKDEKYPENPSNWKQQSYNECARNAIDAEVKRIEEACLNDDPSQCTELGETAAELIVFQNVCSPEFDASATSAPDYKATCREVAYGICRGQVSAKANQYCPDVKVKSDELLDLMDMCEDQVDSMTGGSERPPTDRDIRNNCGYVKNCNGCKKQCADSSIKDACKAIHCNAQEMLEDKFVTSLSE